jgi:hypothetical protein
MSTLVEMVANSVQATDELAQTVSSKFFNAGVLPIPPSLVEDSRGLSALCNGQLDVTQAFDFAGAMDEPWSGESKTGNNTALVTVSALDGLAPYGQLDKLLDPADSDIWDINAVKLEVDLIDEGILVLCSQHIPYLGKTTNQTSFFARVESHTGSVTADVYRSSLDGTHAGAGWLHFSNTQVGRGDAYRIRFTGQGTMTLWLTMLYVGTGSHAGSPVFDFSGLSV